MTKTITRRCEGKRRMQRGKTYGTFKCGRKARFVFQTYVGMSSTHYVCGGEDGCLQSITHGYGANNLREL